MDTSRVTPGELIAGVSGLLLFVFLFFDWTEFGSAWEQLDFVDVLLAIAGLGTAAVVAARAAGTQVNLPGGPTTVIGLEGFAAFWIVLTLIIEGAELKIGIWLALLASIGIVFGALSARGQSAGPPPAPTGGPPPVA